MEAPSPTRKYQKKFYWICRKNSFLHLFFASALSAASFKCYFLNESAPPCGCRHFCPNKLTSSGKNSSSFEHVCNGTDHFMISDFFIEGAPENVYTFYHQLLSDTIPNNLLVFMITKCYCNLKKKFNTVVVSFNFFFRIVILFTLSELPSVGFYEN